MSCSKTLQQGGLLSLQGLLQLQDQRSATLLAQMHLLFMSCHAFHSRTLKPIPLLLFVSLWECRGFAPGTKLLSGKLMSTNSTSCHSLCSWQLHALKLQLLVGASQADFFPSPFLFLTYLNWVVLHSRRSFSHSKAWLLSLILDREFQCCKVKVVQGW